MGESILYPTQADYFRYLQLGDFLQIFTKDFLLVLILTTYCGQIYCKVLAGAASDLTNGGLCHMWRVLVRANLKEGFAMLLANLLLNSNLDKSRAFSAVKSITVKSSYESTFLFAEIKK